MALYLTMFSHFVVSVGSDSCSDIGNRKRLTKNPKSETFQSRKKILERFQVPRGFSEFFLLIFPNMAGVSSVPRTSYVSKTYSLLNYVHCPPAHCYFHFREPVPYSAGPKLQPTVGIESKSRLMHTTCDLRRSISFYN